jgi:hypothetical protein
LLITKSHIFRKHSTDLQVPNVANPVVRFSFRDSGAVNVTGFELEPTFIREMKQAYEAETRADLSKFALGIRALQTDDHFVESARFF